jgi:uncharacterized protein (TIGR00288 family)
MTQSNQTDSRVAVLVDCDNTSPEVLEHALKVVAQFGRVVLRRGYGNHGTLANKWQEALVRLAFTPCLQYQYASGKNTSDIALALDAMEALFDRRADTFCLVTSDSDFAYLCRKLRERGATVYIVGEAKTPPALRNASDMAIKKSDLYSSLWASCDELRGGMDASQYKDYVLFMLFIKYISDKYADSDDFAPPVVIPPGRQLQGHGRAEGQARHRRQDQHPDHPAAGRRQRPPGAQRLPRLQRPEQARQGQGDGGPADQPGRHLPEARAGLLAKPRRARRHPGRRLRIPDAPLRHRKRQEQGPVLHAGRSEP